MSTMVMSRKAAVRCTLRWAGDDVAVLVRCHHERSHAFLLGTIQAYLPAPDFREVPQVTLQRSIVRAATRLDPNSDFSAHFGCDASVNVYDRKLSADIKHHQPVSIFILTSS
ncbi:MAG: hypothetical protein GIW99_10905 [Candidatus Eremiobacteraeota bacterium]|nr:hypothetical protein [Candidatus Eremiobacteraeota bacterium]MBC5828169.1 hypothetical protein [Candidatus Eremiobacteraeota bacterium]